MKRDFKSVLKSQAFLSYLAFQVFGRGPLMIQFTAFQYLADHVLKLSGLEATIIDVVPGLMIFLFVPFYAKFNKRIGIKKTAIWSTTPLSLLFLGFYFAAGFWYTLLEYVLIGVFANVGMFIHMPMMGAIIDEDEQRTGIRKAGLYNGLNALFTIPVAGLRTLIFTSILGGLHVRQRGGRAKRPGGPRHSARGLRGPVLLFSPRDPPAFLLPHFQGSGN